jgi:hypothetical protein
MKRMSTNHPTGLEAVLINNLGNKNKFDVWAKPVGTPKRPIPGVFTRDEKIARIRHAMADYRAGGRNYTEEDIDEIIATW